nr:MAG TPA: hypothetical protein [Caudoviricetes sp.]
MVSKIVELSFSSRRSFRSSSSMLLMLAEEVTFSIF